MRVVIAGGGTAGHVNPAIALAEALAGDRVSFIGTRAGVEARLVVEAGYELEAIDVRGFDRSRPWSLPAVAWRALTAIAKARRIVACAAPDVVVGMGGYVSLPVCLAARSIKTPVVLHEQNIVLGLANRVVKPFAAAVAVSFRDTLARAGHKGVFVGNPVRAEIAGARPERERAAAYDRFDLDEDRKTLLVFGGSQGARSINDAATGLAGLWRDRSDLQVLHIAGRSHAGEIENRVITTLSGAPLIYRVVAYVERMVAAYSLADLALCRSGATTVVELAAMGLPALVVPYPHHRDHQQELHGRVLERAGAAVVVPDAQASAERVAREAEALLGDRARLDGMRASALRFATPRAAGELARVVKAAA